MKSLPVDILLCMFLPIEPVVLSNRFFSFELFIIVLALSASASAYAFRLMRLVYSTVYLPHVVYTIVTFGKINTIQITSKIRTIVIIETFVTIVTIVTIETFVISGNFLTFFLTMPICMI